MKTKLRMFKKAFDFLSKIIINNENLLQNPKVFKTKNGRLMLKSTCPECNNKKSRFVSKNEGSGLLSSLGIRTPLSQIPLLNVLF